MDSIMGFEKSSGIPLGYTVLCNVLSQHRVVRSAHLYYGIVDRSLVECCETPSSQSFTEVNRLVCTGL
jgi:hypothetical protein